MPVEHKINFTDPINIALLTNEMKAALPGKVDGLSAQEGVWVIVWFITAPSAQDQTDAAAVLTAHDPNAQSEKQLHQSKIAALLALFDGDSEEAEYFITLQQGLETVLTNGTPLATFYPGMLANLQSVTAYYNVFINLIEQATTLTQAIVEGTPTPPTAAQMRTVYQAAIDYKDAGMWRVLLTALNKKLIG